MLYWRYMEGNLLAFSRDNDAMTTITFPVVL